MNVRNDDDRERARAERDRRRQAKQNPRPPIDIPPVDLPPVDRPPADLPPVPAATRPRDPSNGVDRADSSSRVVNRRHFVLAAIGLVLVFAVWNAFSLFQPFAGDGMGEGEVSVTIPSGADVGAIGDLLAEKKVVSSGRNFRWRANWSGKSDEFKAGRFAMGEGMSYAAAIDLLVAGPNLGPTRATIPEGRARYEIAAQVAEQGLSGDYMQASEASDELNPRKYGAPKGVESLEGFLFPATYEFAEDVDANVDNLVSQQLAAFKDNIAKVSMRHARSKNLTVFDVLTIASLIDREVSVASERRIVASVIYNRLRAGIPLGIDATSRFETRNWSEPLTNSVLKKDTPYNTRLRRGLPPGPIGNPGLAAIKAAANPARTEYLYYVANPCKPGTHTFEKTDAGFQRAVERYNRARERAGGKQPSGC